MTEPLRQHGIADDPTSAFESLRQEVALLRTAIQGLAAHDESPDYSTTLGLMNKQLRANLDGIERIAQTPAVSLTPEAMVRELGKAAVAVRAEDKRQIDEAKATLHTSIGRIDGIAFRARATADQRHRELRMTAAAFMAGILLWSFLPGMVARSLPASWHVPQWMATRIVRGE